MPVLHRPVELAPESGHSADGLACPLTGIIARPQFGIVDPSGSIAEPAWRLA